MDICEAVYIYLKSQISVNSLIGDRIYLLLLPQKCKLPAVVYSKVSVQRKLALQIDSTFCIQNIQFSCYAKSYSQSLRVANAIRNVLKNYNGNMSEIFVQAVLTEIESESYDSSTETYSHILELQFQFDEGEE